MPKTNPARSTRVFQLASNLEEPLDQALALARALELMAYGLARIGDDHGPAFLATTEALTTQLTTAKDHWRQLVGTKRGSA